MNKFEDIQAFVAVVEAGSFTAAADRLGLDKSVLSRRLAALEKRLGVELIQRTTRAQRLTELGQDYYTRSQRILADLEEAESSLQQAHGALKGSLRVALPLSFGVRHMGRPIAQFQNLHPDIRLDLDLNDRRVDLIEENVDVAIRIGQLQDSSLIARRLFDSRLIACASPHYLSKHGIPTTPEELRQHNCLVYSNLRDPDVWTYDHPSGTHRSLRINAVLRASSGDFLCNAAAQGLGVVNLPTFVAAEHIRRGVLRPILTDVVWPTTPAHAIYPPTRHVSYRVRAFIDFLVEKFAGVPVWDRDCAKTAE